MKRSKTQTLTAYFESEYVLFRNLKLGSVTTLRRTLRAFVAWLGKDPPVSELSDEMLCRWVMHLEKTYAPKTAHGRRGDVLGVWRDAFESDKTGQVQMPRRVRTIRVPEPEPETWSAEEVALLISAARTVPGCFRAEYRAWEVVSRAEYFEALIRTAWETGLRRADLLALRLEQIGPDGVIAKVQEKTGTVYCGQLQPETLALLHKLGRNPPLAWIKSKVAGKPDPCWGLGYWLARIQQLAGLSGEGGLQKIRASAGTNVAIYQPGCETKFLGHTTAKADKWYIDKKRLPRIAVTPQTLLIPETESEGGQQDAERNEPPAEEDKRKIE